jgi:hypothetical protein
MKLITVTAIAAALVAFGGNAFVAIVFVAIACTAFVASKVIQVLCNPVLAALGTLGTAVFLPDESAMAG